MEDGVSYYAREQDILWRGCDSLMGWVNVGREWV